MSFYTAGPFSEFIIVKNEPESESLNPMADVTNNNRASATTEITMPAPNNVVIKTEPTTTHTIEPASVSDEIVVPPLPTVTRKAIARKKTGVHTEPSTSRAMQPATPAGRNTHEQFVPMESTVPNTNWRSIVVKTESISPKRARISPSPDQLYTQLKALGDRGGFITNAEEFDCVICLATIEVGDGVRLRDCLHEFCLSCMKRAIVLSDEAEIPCPFGDGTIKCEGKILEIEIRAILDKDDYEKYLIRSLRIAENTIQNTVHCKLPNCDGWCICEDNVNQFVCQKCNSANCVSCQVSSSQCNGSVCIPQLFAIFDCRQFTLAATANNIRTISNTPVWMVTHGVRKSIWMTSLRRNWE